MNPARTYEVTINGQTIRGIVRVEGRWLPASWGYAGGSPAESPDASIKRVWRYDLDEDGTEIEVDASSLTAAKQDALIEAALLLDEEAMAQPDEGHDVFERQMRSRYPERP